MTAAIFALLVALQVADAWTTVRILAAGGHELNPVLAKWMSLVGTIPALVSVKLTLLILAYRFVWDWRALALVCAAYGWVVFHNFKQMKA